MDINALLATLDEEFEERAEILLHIHEAVMSGEITSDQAVELREEMK